MTPNPDDRLLKVVFVFRRLPTPEASVSARLPTPERAEYGTVHRDSI